MSNPLKDRPTRIEVYYTPPNQIHSMMLLVGIVIAAVVIGVGAIVYALLQPTILLPQLRLVATLVAACGVGLFAGFATSAGKVRSRTIASIVGGFLALFGLYVAWIVWVYNAFDKPGHGVSLSDLIRNPGYLIQCMEALNKSGTWSYHDQVYTGGDLGFIWLIEAGTIFSSGVILARAGVVKDEAMCLECGSRCQRVPNFPRFATDRRDDFLAAIHSRDFASLKSHKAPRNENAPELSILLLSCPRCQKMHVLTVKHVYWRQKNNGQRYVETERLIYQLLVTPEEAQELQAVCGQISQQRAGGIADVKAVHEAVPKEKYATLPTKPGETGSGGIGAV